MDTTTAFDDRDPLPALDAVALVVEASDMVTVFAAHRYRRVFALLTDARDEASARGSVPTELVDRAVRLEVAAALRVTEYSAGRLMQVAEALAVRYPETLALLDGADTTVPHAEFIVDELDRVDVEVRERVGAEVIDLARTLAIGPFRRAVRALIDTARADALTERHRAAITTRRVCVEPAGDGMSWLSTLVPDVEAQAVWQRLTAVATTLASPPRNPHARPAPRRRVLRSADRW